MSNQSFKEEMDTFHSLTLCEVGYAGMETGVLKTHQNIPLFQTTPIPLLALGFL